MSIVAWVKTTIVKKYAGSWIRGGLRVLAGYLLAKGLADEATADAFAGSLGDILVSIIESPELVTAALAGTIGQWWSLKEKKDKKEE